MSKPPHAIHFSPFNDSRSQYGIILASFVTECDIAGCNTDCANMLRRVERNARQPAEGQCLWSLRQTAVYHKFFPPTEAPDALDTSTQSG